MPTPYIDDPFAWFDAWYREALQAISQDPNAMALATVDADGRPSNRIVLLKDWDRSGFVFYTNRESRKGRDLGEDPFAALCFYWREFNRQVRIEGQVERVDDAESDAYFASRARISQLGAWASDQSRPLDSRQTLLERVAHFEEKFGETIPRPPHWGGYRLVPDRIEFWESGEFRLHDRFEFRPDGGSWKSQRLYP